MASGHLARQPRARIREVAPTKAETSTAAPNESQPMSSFRAMVAIAPGPEQAKAT